MFTEMDNELHSIIELPTIADIEASTDVLSIRTNAIKVVRVKERFAVKIGYSIPPLEAENMKFVAANSKVPVPKVHLLLFIKPQKRVLLYCKMRGLVLHHIKSYTKSGYFAPSEIASDRSK
jgi:hypothetical protein